MNLVHVKSIHSVLGSSSAIASLVCLVVVWPGSGSIAEVDSTPALTDFAEITPPMRDAVDRGLLFLSLAQSSDGSYGADSRYPRHVGITALGCLAFMADGHLPGRGRYGSHVERGLDFILQHATESGLVAADTSHGPMYGHGFATLFLGEMYGMTRDPRVRETLLKAVRLIVNTQNHEGGWR